MCVYFAMDSPRTHYLVKEQKYSACKKHAKKDRSTRVKGKKGGTFVIWIKNKMDQLVKRKRMDEISSGDSTPIRIILKFDIFD